MKFIWSLFCVLALMISTSGCEQNADGSGDRTSAPAPPSTEPGPTEETPVAALDVADITAQAEEPGELAQSEQGLIDSVGKALGEAADVGLGAASDSASYVGELYDSLKEKGLTTADSTKQWVTEDFQAMGTWEYKIEVFNPLMDSEVEVAEFVLQLNELGEDRWECFHVQGKVHYFKRPRKSYLRNVPMRDLIKLVPMMSGNE